MIGSYEFIGMTDKRTNYRAPIGVDVADAHDIDEARYGW